MDGRPGDLAARVRRLAEWIQAEFQVPVALLDERLTTCAAEELRREAGGPRRARPGELDRLAAQVLLREFLAAGGRFDALAGEPGP
jgi:putative Holliday junction resolvase